MFTKAARVKGLTGENLLISLEARLDNIVYRLGFAPSRKAARQLVRHRHVRVDGAAVDVPSFRVSPGQEISIAPAAQDTPVVREAMEDKKGKDQLTWLGVDYDN